MLSIRSRNVRVLVIASFVLLGALLAPMAISSQTHAMNTRMTIPTSAPFDHIVTILLENEDLTSVYGSGAYQTALANQNVLVTTWGTINHNSEPNYIALLGAVNDGSTSGDGVCCYFETTPNLVDKFEPAGITWTAFAEDAGNSGTCSFSPPRGGDHFPFIDYSDMNTAARCSHFLTTSSPSSPSGTVADPEFLSMLNSPSPSNFIWLTPNDNDNGHDTGVSGADSYLSNLVPKILSSSEFTTTKATLFLLYDEGYSQCANTGGTGECVYATFSGPATKKAIQISPANASHYSYAATMEAAWGLSSINSNDAGAPNMLSAFGATCTTNCPPPPLTTSFTTSPTTPLVNLPVTFTATTNGGTSPYTVTWNFGDSQSGTGASLTHVFTSAGSFTVTETATDSSSPAQSTSSTQTITVGTPLPLSTSFTTIPPSPSANSPVSFTAAPTGGTSPYSITWNFGDSKTGTGSSVTHTYTSTGSFKITETTTDASVPQQSATSSQTITVLASLSGNFGTCANLPQGWSCGNIVSGAPSPTSAQIVNGVFQSRQSNLGLGGSNSYYYSTTQKGTFPWTPCAAPATGVIPPGVTSVSVNFTSLAFVPSSSPSGDRYHIYIALYYWLPSGAVTASGSTYQCLDTQVRVENVGGTFSPIGSTATYNPGDSFGWDNVTLQTSPGQTGVLIANVANQCLQDLLAWGIPSNTPCQLAGIEIGTEGYQFQELDVNWYDVNLNIGPVPLTTSFTSSTLTPIVNTPVSFTATTIGGTQPYIVNWNFGDGSPTATGSTIAHTYTTTGSFKVTETVTDASTPAQTSTFSATLTVYTSLPLTANFAVSASSPQVGQTITFTATAAGGTGPYTYTVSFGDGNSASGNSVTYSYSTSGSYTAMLTVIDSASPQATTTKTITINVQVLVPPSLTVLGNQTTTIGTWINFTITGASGNQGGTITLSASGLPPGASFDPTTGNFSWKPTASQTGSYTIIFTATDSTNPTSPTSKPMNIQVNQAAPGGSNGGSGGTGGSSGSGCSYCNIIPKLSSNMTLLAVGGILGLVFSLTLLTFRARASLERTKRRLGT